MTYIPGHSKIVAWKAETAAITEASVDGGGVETPAALPSIPTSPAILGYINVPEVTTKRNNTKGFGLGSPYALYNKRGRVTHDLNLDVRIVSLAFIMEALRNGGGVYGLTNLCLYVGTVGSACDVYRLCNIDQLVLNFQESDGEAKELTAQARLMAIAKQTGLGPTLSPSVSTLRALGTPLMWHDVRQFTVGGSDYRKTLMSVSVTLSNNLERKGERPNWGDDITTSRTTYELLPHLVSVSGEAQLHNRLPDNLFDAAASAQDWGDVVISCNDGASNAYIATLKGVMPDTETAKGVEVSAQTSHSVSIVADDLLIASS